MLSTVNLWAGVLSGLGSIVLLGVGVLYITRFPWRNTFVGPWLILAFVLLFARTALGAVDRLVSIPDEYPTAVIMVWDAVVLVLYGWLLGWMIRAQWRGYHQKKERRGVHQDV